MAADPLAELREAQADRGDVTQAQQLIQMAQESADLFHAPDGEPFATASVKGHRETWRIRSREFSEWMLTQYFFRHGKPPRRQARSDAAETLAALAVHDGAERRVSVRLAEHNGAIYLDLGDPAWRAVEIRGDGWRVVDRSPVRFRRPNGVAPIPAPLAGGSVDDLRPFVNVADESSFRLLVAWLIAALRPTGPYPVLALQGEQGSAKSTTTKLLRGLVDPSFVPLRRLPREERDFIISATNCHVLAFDNLSGLQPWHSDIVCCLATGSGFAARQLYTDGDEVLFGATRPVILNGIDAIAARGDLLDRSLVVTLPSISEERRQDELTFDAEYEAARPRILGALLDAVAVALSNVDAVRLPRRPRMADFAMWATAAEPALGWQPGAVLRAYDGNRAEAMDTGLEGDVLAVPLRRVLEADPNGWEGSAAELLEVLEDLVDDDVRNRKTWPGTAQALGTRVRRLAPVLRQAGWLDIESVRTAKRRTLTLRPVDTSVTLVTPVTEADAAGSASVTAPMTPGDWQRVQASPLKARTRADGDGRDGDDGFGAASDCSPEPEGETIIDMLVRTFDATLLPEASA